MIRKYLHDHLGAVLFYLFTILVFWIVAGLYEQYRIEILYATCITAVVGTIFLTVGCFRYVSRMRYLQELNMHANIEECMDKLPETDSCEIQMYQDLLHSLSTSYRSYVTKEEEKYRDRSDYFVMWAHQIKTPIAAMHLLIDDENEPEVKDQLFRIEEYVSIVMHYLKSDDVSQDFVLAEYELDPIIEEAVRHYSSIFIRKKLKLEYTHTDLKVVTDKKWLLFVIEQIISNALKYTKEGSITIACEGNDLIISDTGCGIAPEDLPRLFDKGYTGYNGRINEHASGLGLYLCHRVLQQLGHTIHIESKVGQGTDVTIGLNLTGM
jgi:signal transduction histidine kinase